MSEYREQRTVIEDVPYSNRPVVEINRFGGPRALGDVVARLRL